MNKCKSIHETVIRDVLDVFNDVKNSNLIEGIANRKGNKSFKSIASASSNLTLVFPNLVSRNTNIENAAMANKATERNAVTMLQMLFSALSITNAKDGISYLKQFHTNLKIDDRMTIDKFMNTMDSLVTEGVFIIENSEIYNKYRDDLMNLSYYLPDSISEHGLDEYSITKDFNSLNESVFLEAPTKDPYTKLDKSVEYKDAYGNSYYSDKNGDFFDMNGNMVYGGSSLKPISQYPVNTKSGNGVPYNTTMYDDNPGYAMDVDMADMNKLNMKQSQDFNRTKHKDDMSYKSKQLADKQNQDKFRNNLDKSKFDHQLAQDNIRNRSDAQSAKLARQQFDSRQNKDKIDYLKNQLLDNDVKKSNELVPTTMIVNFISQGDNGEPIQSQMVIGVKAKIYPVSSTDILNRVTIKHKDKNALLGFIKSTTREISFFRDFLLCIDKAKLDALSQSKKGSSNKLWKVLERRGIKSRYKRMIGSINDASAITTLTITQEEVEYLKKSENIDLENPKVIRPIMEAYNFMCVCILDETSEVAKFIYDTGDDIYEQMPFRSLEREDKGNDYRKIINLMTKMR